MKKGPQTPLSDMIHKEKYRLGGESFEEMVNRVSNHQKDDTLHYHSFREVMLDMRFLPGGRIQSSAGSPRKVTAFNCFVSPTLQDSFVTGDDSIMDVAKKAAQTMRMGGGIGYDFTPLRPRGDLIKTLDSKASGPVSFMEIFDAVCRTIASAGHRRGAQMGVLRCLSGDTLIHTLDGKKPIRDLVGTRPYVYACDAESRIPRIVQADKVFVSDTKRAMVRVLFDNGEYIDCTPDHRFMRVDGSYDEAQDLKLGDSLMAIHQYMTKWGNNWKQSIGCTKGRGRAEHRAVAEDILGAEINHTINVHHIDEDTLNNSPSNLEVLTRSEHAKNHASYLEKTRRKIAKDRKGKTLEKWLGEERGSAIRENMSKAKQKQADNLPIWNKGLTGENYKSHYKDGFNNQHSNHKVVSITPLKEEHDFVYDISLPKWHNFAANGVFVHNCDHPDIEEFIHAKQNTDRLTGFNISIAITDEFMQAVKDGTDFDLHWEGRVYKTIDARTLWDSIMRSTWEWAEPGVIFIDRVNQYDNLYYCEEISSTNPSMPAGTPVHTDKGVVPIESLEGDAFKVKSLDGTWADAKCFLSSMNAEVLEIDFGGGKKIQSTKEHKWPVLLNGRYVKVNASDLVIGDRIPSNRNEPMGHEVDSSLTYEDGLMAGLAFGDGSYNIRKDDGRAYLHYHFNKLDVELQEAVSSYFSQDIKVYDDEAVVYISKDDIVRQFVEKVGLSFGEKEGLPSKVWTSNDRFVGGFVDGLISSDGCVCPSNRKLIFTNKNENVVKEFATLLSFHGVLSSFRTSNTTLNDKTFKRTDLTLAHNSVKRFVNVFHLSCLRKQASLVELCEIDTRSNILTDHLEVKSISLVGRKKVWDISVYHDQHVFPTAWGYTGNCSEQPLPPNGACLLGSFNLTKYVDTIENGDRIFNFDRLKADIPIVVRAMDNVIDRTTYPLKEQEAEAKAKRRMGLGITGLANALESLDDGNKIRYGDDKFIWYTKQILQVLRDETYRASAMLANEKGSFPMFDAEKYLAGKFAQTLPKDVRSLIEIYGLRNSHLTSIAPTGTISFCADNVSSGIEPVFMYEYNRVVQTFDGPTEHKVEDYGKRVFGVKGKTTSECSADDHLNVLLACQPYIDSAISKTCNVNPEMPWEDFKDIYFKAWLGDAKGCTTFNPGGKRFGILNGEGTKDDAGDEEAGVNEGTACYIDETTGRKTCE